METLKAFFLASRCCYRYANFASYVSIAPQYASAERSSISAEICVVWETIE